MGDWMHGGGRNMIEWSTWTLTAWWWATSSHYLNFRAASWQLLVTLQPIGQFDPLPLTASTVRCVGLLLMTVPGLNHDTPTLSDDVL